MAEYAAKFGMAIDADVLMTNHAHILVTPGVGDSILKTMQSLGRQSVRYFNNNKGLALGSDRFKDEIVR